MKQEQLEFEVRRVPAGKRRLLFINGYGGNFEQPGVEWYMNRLREHGLDITYIQLPTRVKDFKEDVLRPCLKVERGMGEHVSAGFSFGGLVLTYMFGAKRRVFLSPFWAVNERWVSKGSKAVVKLLSMITKPIIPRHFDKEDAGELAVEDDMKGIPEMVSFRTIEQFFEAQDEMPEPMENDIAFYSPKDRVVSPDAIEKRGVELRPYPGGHMFYLTRKRKEIMEQILSAIDEGYDQSHSAN